MIRSLPNYLEHGNKTTLFQESALFDNIKLNISGQKKNCTSIVNTYLHYSKGTS